MNEGPVGLRALTSVSLPTRISTVRSHGRDHRVIRPRDQAPGITLQCWRDLLLLDADSDALKQFAAAWTLAAFSSRSIIYLPLRRNENGGPGRRLDLVLLHSSLQFRLSRWKELRSRLGTGVAHTARLSVPSMLPELSADRERWKVRQTRNCLIFDTADETLFVVGNRDGFRLTANDVGRFSVTEGWLIDVYGGRRHSDTGRHGMPSTMLVEGIAVSPGTQR